MATPHYALLNELKGITNDWSYRSVLEGLIYLLVKETDKAKEEQDLEGLKERLRLIDYLQTAFNYADTSITL